MRLHMPLNSQFMYKRLKKIRGKAIRVGLLYLFGIVLLAILALVPMLKVDYLCLIPGIFGDKMLWTNINLSWDIDTISRILYILMIANVTFVLPILGFRKLNWLFTKRSVKRRKSNGGYNMNAEQSNYRGFNRNVYAMKDLASIFSWSFAILLIGNVLICALNGSYAGEKFFDFSALMENAVLSLSDFSLGINVAVPLIVFVMVIGFLVTLIGRLGTVKVRLFTTSEDVRIIGAGKAKLSVFLRTLLQFIAIIAVPVFLLQVNTLNEFVTKILSGGFGAFKEFETMQYVSIGVELFVWLSWLALTYCPIIYCHKCMLTEYNMPEKDVDYYYMLGVSIASIVFAVGLFVVKDNFAFDFSSVASLNTLMIAGILLVISLATGFLTKSAVQYSEYEQVMSMVTSNDEYEDIDWRYFFSDNYVGGEETGDIIDIP